MRILWGIVVCLVLAGCGPKPPDIDQQARYLATEISYQPHISAFDYARAALHADAGRQSGRDFAVLEMKDLNPAAPDDPSAHLVVRLHGIVYRGFLMWSSAEPATACFGMDFGRAGVIGIPARVTCPENAVPITAPAWPDWNVGGGYEQGLKNALAVVRFDAGSGGVVEALRREHLVDSTPSGDRPIAQPGFTVDVTAMTPPVTCPCEPSTHYVATDVGVAFRGPDGQCVFGSRVSGNVHVWRPDAAQVTCDARTALTSR